MVSYQDVSSFRLGYTHIGLVKPIVAGNIALPVDGMMIATKSGNNFICSVSKNGFSSTWAVFVSETIEVWLCVSHTQQP